MLGLARGEDARVGGVSGDGRAVVGKRSGVEKRYYVGMCGVVFPAKLLL